MYRRACSCLGILVLLLTSGCGPKTMFPPEVDLGEYGSVGLISFSSNFEGNLGEFVTQKFLESISTSQKGARIIVPSYKELSEMVGMTRFAITRLSKRQTPPKGFVVQRQRVAAPKA